MPSNPERCFHRSFIWILGGISLLSVGVYLVFSRIYYHNGFPLDDAWIHQTYARNLALRGEWAFLPGQPSGGSTAPLWSALLAIGYGLRLAPYVWTYLLGAVILFAVAVFAETSVRTLSPTYRPRWPWIGTFFALEWHLVWAAGSGMETLFFTALTLFVIIFLLRGTRNFFGLGLMIGLSVWVRPDGITLLGPAILTAFLVQESWRRRFRYLLNLGLGFGSLFALYLLFNLALNSSPWPNTFYAKQAEYAILQQRSLWLRFGKEALQPLIGAGIALLPGWLMTLISAIRNRRWGILVSVVWFLGYLGLYAWRLPVTYQHGRYVIPAMPIFFLLGLIGLIEFVQRQYPHRLWMLPVLWKMVIGLLVLIFWLRGSFAYAQDVAVIESEMVVAARWVSVNVPPDALVAAHDIGALGYFSNHHLVDLAGLVSPDVIPFIRDENRIANYLDEQGVTYLVTFPGWYPSLTRRLNPVYTTGGPYAPAFGEENMRVYLWSER